MRQPTMRHDGRARLSPDLFPLLVIALGAVLGLVCAAPSAGQLVPAGGPWLLEGDYLPPSIFPPGMVLLVHPDGGFLALWQQGSHENVWVSGRRFGDAGPIAPVLDFGPGTLFDAAMAPDRTVLISGGGVVRRARLDGQAVGSPWVYDDGRVEPGTERCRDCVGGGSVEAAIAIDPSGEMLVAWPVVLRLLDPEVPVTQWGQLLVRRFDAEGRALGDSQPIDEGFAFWNPAVTAAGGGAFLVTADRTYAEYLEFDDGVRILVDAAGTLHRMAEPWRVWEVRTAVAPGGRSLSVYTQSGEGWESDDGDCTGVFGLFADGAGDLSPAPVDLPRDRSDCQWQARVAATSDGFVVGWQTDRISYWAEGPATNPFHGISLRRFDPDGRPVGDPLDLRLGRSTFFTDPETLILADLAFADGRAAVLIATSRSVWAALAKPVPGGPCRPGADHLCLGGAAGDRFRVDAAYLDPYAGGAPGRGFAHPLTADTGAFWLFHPDNLELAVKVLDGRSVNGRFWVLAGAATTVEWAVTVTDTATREQWGRSAAPYRLATVADITALPRPPSPSDPGTSLRPGPGLVGTRDEVDLGGRYRVRVAWTDPWSGASGVGQGLAATEDAALFWFFDPANVELMVKVIDGRPVNGHAWVFWGSLTGVAFDLQVEDTVSGMTRTYRNEPFALGGGSDTAAFPFP